MRDISDKDLLARYIATKGALCELKTTEYRRRYKRELDFQAVGDPFLRDYSDIVASKAHRRMGHKNQVASGPNRPHVRDRATHTNEVSGITTQITDHLGLNVGLGLSGSTGHDTGHVPFGHQGEHYIQQRVGANFTHETMGVVIAQHIERLGMGMNCTYQTLEAMHGHSGANAKPNMSQEAWVINNSDKIAYLFADYNDFRRLDWVCSAELSEQMDWFGINQRDRTFRTIVALCEESAEAGYVSFNSSEPARKFKNLRRLMYKEYEKIVIQDVSGFLDPIYDFLERSEMIPAWLGVALLTDDEVIRLRNESSILCSKSIMNTGLGEMIRSFPKEDLWKIKCEPDLDW
jgi:dGTPase